MALVHVTHQKNAQHNPDFEADNYQVQSSSVSELGGSMMLLTPMVTRLIFTNFLL